MASRKFKPEWSPTPLYHPGELDRRPQHTFRPPPTTLFRRKAVILWLTVRFFLRELVRWGLGHVWPLKERSAVGARQARETLERLGGMWVTLAHLLSLRHDILGQSICRELAQTRDLVAAIPFPLIREVVEDELRQLGTSFDAEFSEFAEQPMSTRSSGQTHFARLRKSGYEVFVRVRAPEAVQRFAIDWRGIKRCFAILSWLDIEPHLKLDDLLFEVKQSAEDLLDFRTEVTELKKVRRVLAPRRVYIPFVFDRLCSEKLFIVEYVHGVSVADLAYVHSKDPKRCNEWLRANKDQPPARLEPPLEAQLELVFENRLFYTNLQPPATLLLKNNRIALVNLYTIGVIDAQVQRKYVQLCQALLESDYTKSIDTYLAIGPALPYKDSSGVRLNAGRALRAWESRTHIKQSPYSQKSLASAMEQLASSVSNQKLPLFWNLARLQLAEKQLDVTLEFLDTTKDSIKALRRYERAAQLRTVKRVATRSSKQRVNNAFDMSQLNAQLVENLEHDAEYLRQRLMGFQGDAGRVAQVIGRFVLNVARALLVLLIVELIMVVNHRYRGVIPIPEKGTLSRIISTIEIHSITYWGIFVGIVFGLQYLLRKLANRLFSAEVRPSDVL